jgi:CheY-like chemotaxis protein
MAPDVLEHAFEPFFTTKDIGAGSGLGLSQVFGFVKQSGGHLTISSEPGTGTTVKVYLPRHSGESLRAAEGAEASAPLQDLRGRETVLVVDDEADIRSYASEALKDLGYQVIEAHDASSGLAALDAHPEAALLLTDVVLPGMNGRDLALEARRRRPALRVLYTTGDTSNAITESSVVARDAAVLTKPFRIAALASTVRKALDANFASAG